MREWISVQERMPHRPGSYLVYTGKGCAFTARYTLNPPRFNGRASLRIQWWMPLPKPPKEDEHA